MNKMNNKKTKKLSKLEKEIKVLCNEMIANIEGKKRNISIEEIKKSGNMWCELATL